MFCTETWEAGLLSVTFKINQNPKDRSILSYNKRFSVSITSTRLSIGHYESNDDENTPKKYSSCGIISFIGPLFDFTMRFPLITLFVHFSVAIMIYLCDKYADIPDHWYPKEPKRRAKIHQFLGWHPSTLRKLGTDIFLEKVGPHNSAKLTWH